MELGQTGQCTVRVRPHIELVKAAWSVSPEAVAWRHGGREVRVAQGRLGLNPGGARAALTRNADSQPAWMTYVDGLANGVDDPRGRPAWTYFPGISYSCPDRLKVIEAHRVLLVATIRSCTLASKFNLVVLGLLQPPIGGRSLGMKSSPRPWPPCGQISDSRFQIPDPKVLSGD